VFAAALRSRDQDVREKAAEHLGELGPAVRVAVPALAEALHDPSEEVRGAALGALGLAGEIAQMTIPRVIELLNNPAHRWGAASVLERIGPGASNAIPHLIKAARRRATEEEQEAMLSALGAIAPDDDRVRNILLKSLRDRRYLVRLAAVEALGNARSGVQPVLEALEHAFHNDKTLEVRFAAADAILDIEPGDGHRLTGEITSLLGWMDQEDRQGLATATRLLGRIGLEASSAIPTLNGLLSHKHFNVRVAAAEALARVKPDGKRQNIELLRQLLTQDQLWTRLSAANALWRLSPEDAPAIATVAAELLVEGETPPQFAAQLLVEMGPAARSVLPRLKQALESGLADRRSQLVWEAMEAIQQVK
jgi:HEAT repeat protein